MTTTAKQMNASAEKRYSVAASSCAKENSTAFTSIDKPRKSAAVPRHREIPREQFEAFAALLEFRRRSEAFRNV
jgi:hypothetical protein